MYVICVYDVEEKRCNKVMKLLNKYLFRVQNSVFEGELTPVKFNEVKEKLNVLIKQEDSVIFYYTYENKKFLKESLMGEDNALNIII